MKSPLLHFFAILGGCLLIALTAPAAVAAVQNRAAWDALDHIVAAEQSRFDPVQETGYSDDIAALLADVELKYEDGHPLIDGAQLESLTVNPDGDAFCVVVRSPNGSYFAASERNTKESGPLASSVEAQDAALCLPTAR